MSLHTKDRQYYRRSFVFQYGLQYLSFRTLGYSDTYGTKAINRARLIAVAKFR